MIVLQMAPFLFYSTIPAPTQGLLSASFLAALNVPTPTDPNSFGADFADYVFAITETRRILELRYRSIDSLSTDRTEIKAQLRELNQKITRKRYKLSVLKIIASAKVFVQPKSSLDAIASALKALDRPRTQSYLDTNSSTANLSTRRNPYCNASQS